jgi:hypothetical protein
MEREDKGGITKEEVMRNSTRTKLAATAIAIAALGFGAAVPAQAATLDATTVKDLQYMVAEEKLAHDVYTTLGDMYNVRVFDRIASSEARHQDALRTVMDLYGVADPTVGDKLGVFDDPTLQNLYTTLVAQGSASLTEAAKVGIAIEKLDIADLKEAMDKISNADVERVYSSLLQGSENHLAAFSRWA